MTSTLGSRFAGWWLRRRTVGWGWVLPLAAFRLTDSIHPHDPAVTWLPLAVGIVAGAAWQLVSPRDLVDRLSLVASLLLVAGVLQAVVRVPWVIFPVDRENWTAAGVLVGLVFTTHARRSRRIASLAASDARRRGPAQPSLSSSSASTGSRRPTQSCDQNGSQ